MKVSRSKLKIGNEYYLGEGDSLSVFFYLGKFYDDLEEKDSLCFYPMNDTAKSFFKKEDGTVCFCDVDSFFMYEEVE